MCLLIRGRSHVVHLLSRGISTTTLHRRTSDPRACTIAIRLAQSRRPSLYKEHRRDVRRVSRDGSAVRQTQSEQYTSESILYIRRSLHLPLLSVMYTCARLADLPRIIAPALYNASRMSCIDLRRGFLNIPSVAGVCVCIAYTRAVVIWEKEANC